MAFCSVVQALHVYPFISRQGRYSEESGKLMQMQVQTNSFVSPALRQKETKSHIILCEI